MNPNSEFLDPHLHKELERELRRHAEAIHIVAVSDPSAAHIEMFLHSARIEDILKRLVARGVEQAA